VFGHDFLRLYEYHQNGHEKPNKGPIGHEKRAGLGMTLKINLIGYISLSKYIVIPFQDQHSNAE
jgi:hypothetical protein